MNNLLYAGTNHRVTAPISHSICQSSPLIHNRDSGGVVGNETNSNQAKKSLYENHGVATCSHNRALCIATIVFAFLFTLAVIIAFTGPQTGNLIPYLPIGTRLDESFMTVFQIVHVPVILNRAMWTIKPT